MLTRYWHTMLDMSKKSLDWHKNDIADELKELEESTGLINYWSELSDVAYTYTRAKWSGHKIKRPIKIIPFFIGLIYMFPKYTLRWYFYYSVGKKFDKKLKITEVRNPKKSHKLREIAIRWNLDPELFEKEAKNKMKSWIFLK